MGSFSWISAPKNKNERKVRNIWCVDYDNESWKVPKQESDNASFIMYIPKEFGGGFIFDKSYQDYGKINDFDMYALFGLMNEEPEKFKKIMNTYHETGKVDEEYSDYFRDWGINLDTRATIKPHRRKTEIKYPLKLRQVNSKEIDYSIEDFNLSYEDIEGYSANDPNQGFHECEYDIEINPSGLIEIKKEYYNEEEEDDY